MKTLIKSALLAVLCLSLLLLSGCASSQYKDALALMEAGDYSAAAAIFAELEDYKDAEDQLSLCKQKISYQEALDYLNAGDYDQAFNCFSMLGVFEDSAEKASESLYLKAGELFDSGFYSEAAELYSQLGEYSDSAERHLESQYLYAENLISRYSYERARSILSSLGSYRDCTDKIAGIDAALSEQSAVNSASVGEVVYFGSFEQDNDPDNGAESLAWVVLEKDEDKMLLLCRDAIETLPYNSEFAATDWESSTLRKWLNEDFFAAAFSEADAARLLPMIDSSAANADDGSKVFLLSAEEAGRVLAQHPDFAPAVPSEAAQAKGAGLRKNGSVCWWLRDNGFAPSYAAYAGSDGSVNTTGVFCGMRQFCVRPAIWLRLTDLTETESVSGTSVRAEAAESADAPWQLAETPDAGEEYVNSIIFLGDSTTYGYVTVGMPTSQIWTPDSHTMSIYQQSFVYVETTKGPMLIRDAAKTLQPDLMVITLGIRHITTMKEQEFKAEYTDLVNGILETSPNTKIILNSVYPVADFLDPRELAVTNDMIDTVNGWIQYVVQQTGVRYLDSNTMLKGDDGYMVRSYARSDGLHLSPEALNLVLENIRTHAYQ